MNLSHFHAVFKVLAYALADPGDESKLLRGFEVAFYPLTCCCYCCCTGVVQLCTISRMQVINFLFCFCVALMDLIRLRIALCEDVSNSSSNSSVNCFNSADVSDNYLCSLSFSALSSDNSISRVASLLPSSLSLTFLLLLFLFILAISFSTYYLG